MISSENVKKVYSGNGSTTVFPYDFKINEAAHLAVVIADEDDVQTTLTLDTHYTVSGVGEDAGGNVSTLNLSSITGEVDHDLPTGWTIAITRIVPLTQETDFENQGGFFASTHEDAFDKVTQALQQINEELGRTPKASITSGETGEGVMASIYDARDDSEAAQAAAEAAQGLSEAARDASIAAQGLSEAARDASVAAKVSSEAARDLAEGYKNTAVAASGAATLAKQDAETAQGLSEAAKTDAETAAINAGLAQLACETAQGLSEDARDSALASAGVASDFAADAQTAQGLAEDARDAAIAAADSQIQTGDDAVLNSLYIGEDSKNASAAIQIDSTDKGFLPPRMTTAQRDLIPTPPQGLEVYNTTTNQKEIYNGSSWVAVGASSGSTGVNYITAYNGEDTTGGVTGWGSYKDAAGAAPVDADGGTVTAGHTITASATDPLRDLKSILVTKPASDCQGEGFVWPFTLARADRNRPLYLTGSVEMDGTYVADTYLFYLVNVTSGAVTRLQGSVSGNRITLVGYTDANTSYRLAVHCATNSAVAMSFKLDDLSFGPDKLIDGPIVEFMGDVTLALSTGSGTGSTGSAKVWRNNDMMIVQYTIVSGTSTGANAAGFTIPFGKTVNNGASKSLAPAVTSAAAPIAAIISSVSATDIWFAPALNATITTRTLWNTIGDSKAIHGTVSFQVVEWANQSAVLSTTEMMNGVSSLQVGLAATQTIAPATLTTIQFDTVIEQVGNGFSYDSSTGIFTANRKMRILCIGRATWADSTDWDIGESFYFRLGGPAHSPYIGFREIDNNDATTIGLALAVSGSAIISANAGQTFSFNLRQVSFSNQDLMANKDMTYAHVIELPDFSVYGVYGNYEELEAVSSYFTLDTAGYATTEYPQMSGNFIPLKQGTWCINGSVEFLISSAVTPTQFYAVYRSANGDNTTTAPATINSGANYVSSKGNGAIRMQGAYLTASADYYGNMPELIITVSGDYDLYLVPVLNFSGTGDASSSMLTRITAIRLR